MPISNAIPQDMIARVIGTKFQFVDKRNIPQNVPIQVAILAPPSDSAEGSVEADKAFDFVSAKEVGDEFGYNSPAYRVARMLRPEFGGGVSTILTSIFPVIPTTGVQSADVLAINIAGVNPTKTTEHRINVNGRKLPFAVLITDTVTELADRIKATLDAALTVNPVISVVEAAVVNDIDITVTAGWNGVSGDEINISIEADDAAGIIYTNPIMSGGAGVFDVAPALANFGETWYNVVINACDVVSENVMDQIEAFNGTPEDNTGRWNGLVSKPFVAFYGSVESDKDDSILIPDTRKLDLSNCKCPAPGSPGFTFEAAAAYVRYIALTASENPPKSYSGGKLLDMPAPDDPTLAGDFRDVLLRDFIEKGGVSTATLQGGFYFIEDVNTHYHPDGVNPAASPYFRVVHVLGRTFTIIFQYRILEESALMDKILVEDLDETENPDAISPDAWGSIVREFISDLGTQAITTKSDDARKTVKTGIGEQNPERVETSFELTFSNNVRQGDTTINFGFNFGG